MMNKPSADRQNLLDRLLDAVKQCQVRFGGKSELATDSDSRVSCLCAQFEVILMHGLKKFNTNPLSAIKQMTGISVAGLPIIGGELESGFWLLVKEHLTVHELQRYETLKNISTDAGRCRAWLRSTLNEHSLERYLHMILGNHDLLRQYYESYAFLLDEERSSMLPTMARGLGSILFAISIDKEELNGTKQMPTLASLIQGTEIVKAQSIEDQDVEAVYAVSAPASTVMGSKESKKKKKKKKGPTSIVSFDDDESSTTVISTSPSRRSRLAKHSTDSFESSSSSVDPGSTATPPAVVQAGGDQQRGFDLTLSVIAQTPEQESQKFVVKEHENEIHENAEISEEPKTYSGFCEDNQNKNENSAVVNSQTFSSADIDLQRISNSDLSQTSNTYPVQNGNHGGIFPGKTPPSTPYESNLLNDYEQMRNRVDASALADQLQEEAESTPDVESDFISTDSNAQESPAHLNSGRGAGTMSGSQSERESPLLSKQSFHLLEEDVGGSLYPVNQDIVINQEDSQSNDSSLLNFGAETDGATLGLALAQKGLTDGKLDEESSSANKTEVYQSMSQEELKQAVLTIMGKNDELQDKNRSLRSLLDSEMEHSAKVRGQMEEVQKIRKEQETKLTMQLESLTRENEVLKNQLKKYVGAVQMLRRDASANPEGLPGIRFEEPQPVIPEPKNNVDYGEQARQYEDKLIQVAEMHGELMEFNEYLTRQIRSKDFLLQRLKEELVDLRGPLPEDLPSSEVNSPDSDNASLSTTSRSLINLWIPSAFLRGKNKDGFHVYQVYIRIKDEEWNIYRRYSEFRDLHLKLRKAYPIVNTYDFPPKKTMGNKDSKFVEIRRKKLQHYIRCVINFAVSNFPELSESPTKESLVVLLPFFGSKHQRNDVQRVPKPYFHNQNNKPKSDPSSRKRMKPAPSQQGQLLTGRRATNPTYEGL